MIFDRDENTLARRSARNFSIILAVSSAINFARWYVIDNPLAWVWFDTALVSTFFSILMHFWRRPRILWSSIVFWIGFLLACYGSGITIVDLVDTDIQFSAFAGFKIIAIVLAIIAPQPAWNGYFSIAACGLIPTVMYFTVLSDAHAQMSVQEPGVTIVTVAICLLGLVYRNRSLELERSYARLVAETEKLQEFAHIFLALRDLTNTPLQIISLTVNLMKENRIPMEKAADHLKNSVAKLTQISSVLAEYQQNGGSELGLRSIYNSKDPVEFLRNRLNALKGKKT